MSTGRARFATLAASAALLAGPVTAQEAGQAATLHEGEVAVQIGLGDAVGMALSGNPELEAARYAVAEASERVSEAWGSVYPTVDFTSSYVRNLTPQLSFLPAVIFDPSGDPNELIPVRFGADNLWNFSVDVEQPIFNAAAFIGVGAAGRFQALQDESFRGQAQAIVTRVREAYYRLLLDQEQVRLLENSIGRVRASLAETRALAEAGLSSEYDVLRLEVELANLEPNLRRAREAVAQGRRTLAVEVGLEPDVALMVRGSLATMRLDEPASNSADNLEVLVFGGPPTAGADAMVDEAMRLRSDLLQLELTENLRTTEMRLEQVQYLPKVSLFGSYSLATQQNGGADFFGGPQAYTRLAGVRVTVPLFQGFQRDARIDQKRALLEQARVQTQYTRRQAENEVRTLVAATDEARERADAQALAVRQATRGYEIASAQYREGIGSQLELTDAEVALRQSEFNYAEAVHDFLVARARLDRAAGRVTLEGTTADAGQLP